MGAQLTDPWTPIAFHRPKTNDHRFEEDILSRGSALASFLLTRKVWERGQGVTLKIMHGKASAEDTVKKRNNQAKVRVSNFDIDRLCMELGMLGLTAAAG